MRVLRRVEELYCAAVNQAIYMQQLFHCATALRVARRTARGTMTGVGEHCRVPCAASVDMVT